MDGLGWDGFGFQEMFQSTLEASFSILINITERNITEMYNMWHCPLVLLKIFVSLTRLNKFYFISGNCVWELHRANQATMKTHSFNLILALLPVLAFSNEDICNFPDCQCPENFHQPGWILFRWPGIDSTKLQCSKIPPKVYIGTYSLVVRTNDVQILNSPAFTNYPNFNYSLTYPGPSSLNSIIFKIS